ncbi:unnamed protein product [Rodentolepis nana]|uniref:Uncharacterized protein n=1 Tax=Rodentolepis nana TaxID=102285 RepID=A0A0R3TYJ2_RODNA|nr:unnamed protein product [Rodentolepis nana]
MTTPYVTTIEPLVTEPGDVSLDAHTQRPKHVAPRENPTAGSSEVSVIPRSKKRYTQATRTSLVAANNAQIHVYGQKFLNLDLGLCQESPFTFYFVDVQQFITGTDFLSRFQLWGVR